MKIIIIILTILFLPSYVFTQEIDIKPKGLNTSLKDDLKNFRGNKFGYSKKEVKENEKIELSNLPNSDKIEILGGETIVNGFQTNVYYYFIEDEFLLGVYSFNLEHSNKNLFIDDFNSIKKILIDKYGKPQNDDIIWNQDLYKNDYSQRGMAVSIGHLNYQTNWSFNNGNIRLTLSGDNFEIHLSLAYIEKTFYDKRDKIISNTDEF